MVIKPCPALRGPLAQVHMCVWTRKKRRTFLFGGGSCSRCPRPARHHPPPVVPVFTGRRWPHSLGDVVCPPYSPPPPPLYSRSLFLSPYISSSIPPSIPSTAWPSRLPPLHPSLNSPYFFLFLQMISTTSVQLFLSSLFVSISFDFLPQSSIPLSILVVFLH